jgi:Fe-S cluster assembly ATP-binding protein
MGPNGSGNDPGQHPRQPRTWSPRAAFVSTATTSRWPRSRAKASIFLAFQYPQEIAGVSVIISCARHCRPAGIDLSVLELRLSIMDWMKRLTRPSPIAT